MSIHHYTAEVAGLLMQSLRLLCDLGVPPCIMYGPWGIDDVIGLEVWILHRRADLTGMEKIRVWTMAERLPNKLARSFSS